MTKDTNDIHFMRAALSMARRGLGRVAPNPSVGCVIVKNDIVIGRGRTADQGRPHAEAAALDAAGRAAHGAAVYVTLEPCALPGRAGPCAEALVAAGVKRVVIACIDPNPQVLGKGVEILKRAGIEVVTGFLEREAEESHKGFFLRMKEKRPMVTLKAAITKDGRITPPEGSRWITGDLSRRHAHLERAMHDAILVGIGTVLADDPLLTTRLPGYEHRIIRVVMDRHLRIPAEGRLVQSAKENPLWVFHAQGSRDKAKQLEDHHVRVLEGGDAAAVARCLAEEGVTRLMVEGGPMIWEAFIDAGLYDRLLLYKSPIPSPFRGEGQGEGESQGNDWNFIPALPHPHPGPLPEGRGRMIGMKLVETRLLDEDLLEIYEKQA